jgi:hypothetical protein
VGTFEKELTCRLSSSRLEGAQVEPWEAADYLAMSEKVLRDIYVHLHPEHQKSAAEALSKRGSRTGR